MRIVTLVPSATEIVARLGAASQIVGISHERDEPSAVLDRLRVTSTTLPDEIGTRAIDNRVVQAMVKGEPLVVTDAEQLAALRPDLVVTLAHGPVFAAVTPTHIGLIEDLTDARVIGLQARDFGGVLSDVRAVGEALERPSDAARLTGELDERWTELSAPDPSGPRVLFAEWADPLWIGGHWIPELIAHAGGIDPYGRAGAPPERSTWADALAQSPDIVVFGTRDADTLGNRDTASVIPTEGARRYAIDALRLTRRAGPRLVRALAAMRAVVRGELSGVDPSDVMALPPAG